MRCGLHAVLLLGMLPAAAIAQLKPVWMTQLGTAAKEVTEALAPDGQGGVFGGGVTYGKLGGQYFGEDDIFLARLDSAGSPMWIKQVGTSEHEETRALLPDGAGGFFLAGDSWGVLAPPGFGASDVVLGRFDADGAMLWMTQFGSTKQDYATALAPADRGGVFVAGYTAGAMAGQNKGSNDIFLARFDGAGTHQWTVQLGSADLDVAYALASDGAGGVYLAAGSRGDYGGKGLGGMDVVVARYGSTGRELWVRKLGSTDDDYAAGAIPDGLGGVYVAGAAPGKLGGGPESGGVFVARYKSNGDQVWAQVFLSYWTHNVRAMTSDGSGGVIVAGGADGAGGADAYFARILQNGKLVTDDEFGTDGIEQAYALAPASGGFFAGGYTTGSMQGPQQGVSDAFVVRFGSTCDGDCDLSGALDMDDFVCFQTRFAIGDLSTDCDHSGELDPDDFICFQTAFARGCP